MLVRCGGWTSIFVRSVLPLNLLGLRADSLNGPKGKLGNPKPSFRIRGGLSLPDQAQAHSARPPQSLHLPSARAQFKRHSLGCLQPLFPGTGGSPPSATGPCCNTWHSCGNRCSARLSLDQGLPAQGLGGFQCAVLVPDGLAHSGSLLNAGAVSEFMNAYPEHQRICAVLRRNTSVAGGWVIYPGAGFMVVSARSTQSTPPPCMCTPCGGWGAVRVGPQCAQTGCVKQRHPVLADQSTSIGARSLHFWPCLRGTILAPVPRAYGRSMAVGEARSTSGEGQSPTKYSRQGYPCWRLRGPRWRVRACEASQEEVGQGIFLSAGGLTG